MNLAKWTAFVSASTESGDYTQNTVTWYDRAGMKEGSVIDMLYVQMAQQGYVDIYVSKIKKEVIA
mgnify:CR=1 FL=1